MDTTGSPYPGPEEADAGIGGATPDPSSRSALLDVLNVAAVVLDERGRIVLWSPQARDVFGYTADEALGRYAARLLVHEEHIGVVTELFADVMRQGHSWAGVFPVRHKDGGTRLLEFRNMRLRGENGDLYALGLATEQSTLRRVERDLALSTRLIAQSPIGLAVMDTELRFVTVNPALARISGVPGAQHTGRHVREALSFLDAELVEPAMRQVLETGVPLVDQNIVGRTPTDPDNDHAWSVSYHRLEAGNGAVIGLAISVVDVTDRHRAATEAAHARQRLAMVADASVLIGTTLDLEQTARELAAIVVPDLADVAAVDVLDTALRSPGAPGSPPAGPALFRALAVASAQPTEAVRAADPVGDLTSYEADSLVARCVGTGTPFLVPRVMGDDLRHIARDREAAGVLGRAGVHSYLVVPLIARGSVLGVLDLKRIGNPLPFDDDDLVLAGELASRAAVSIDNARWYQREHDTALTLQRSLLPSRPPPQPGLELAYRYQPAAAAGEVGGDWFDVIPLTGDKTALVVGDVMGSGVTAAATMGQLRNTTRALADLDLDPADLLGHVDRSTTGLEQSTATCVYVVYDPHRRECRMSTAGHLPPIRVPADGGRPELLDLPPGVPLGVGGFPFHTATVELAPGDQLVLYTDGLVEVRDESIDARLERLMGLLDDPGRPLNRTCDQILHTMRGLDHHDDVALLIARVQPHPGSGGPP
ncbi:SpoIIE family protein phosphatase [Streptomyces sp. NPDC047928]|uniref:SpoIIE family protein phosphatase n=1 Tax=unclassified Streptomyces TaxID=2593676 RepID=UPI00372219BE